jgi:pimeloyl-ACP methyl ester carboxylesterase
MVTRFGRGGELRPTKGLEMLCSAPVDGFRLAYERSGSGPSVVLLHGWPGDHTDWDQLVPRLTDVADVLATDLRGFGSQTSTRRIPRKSTRHTDRRAPLLRLWMNSASRRRWYAGYDVVGAVSQTVAAKRPIL